MSDDHNEAGQGSLASAPLGLLISVAMIAAMLGFAAVYVTGKLTANTVPPDIKSAAAQATAPVAQPAPTPTALTAERSEAAQPVSTEPTSNGGLPTGPGKNDLSVGEMAMFVFKAPHPLPPVSFEGPDGQTLSFDNWKGRIALVNLWATWCGPCRKEMPDLARLQKKVGGPDFEVVAVSVDRGSNAKPAAFLKEVEADALALYHDPAARINQKLRFIGLPATILLDRQGREIGRLVGPAKWDSDDAIKLVKRVIDATARAGQ